MGLKSLGQVKVRGSYSTAKIPIIAAEEFYLSSGFPVEIITLECFYCLRAIQFTGNILT